MIWIPRCRNRAKRKRTPADVAEYLNGAQDCQDARRRVDDLRFAFISHMGEVRGHAHWWNPELKSRVDATQSSVVGGSGRRDFCIGSGGMRSSLGPGVTGGQGKIAWRPGKGCQSQGSRCAETVQGVRALSSRATSLQSRAVPDECPPRRSRMARSAARRVWWQKVTNTAIYEMAALTAQTGSVLDPPLRR